MIRDHGRKFVITQAYACFVTEMSFYLHFIGYVLYYEITDSKKIYEIRI